MEPMPKGSFIQLNDKLLPCNYKIHQQNFLSLVCARNEKQPYWILKTNMCSLLRCIQILQISKRWERSYLNTCSPEIADPRKERFQIKLDFQTSAPWPLVQKMLILQDFYIFIFKENDFSWRNLARIFQDKHFFNDNLARYIFSQRILKELNFQIKSVNGIKGSDL